MKYLLASLIFLFSVSSWAVNINLKKSIVVGGQPTVHIKLNNIIEPNANIGELSERMSDIKFINIKKEETIAMDRVAIVKRLREIKKSHKVLSKVNFVIPSELKITHVGYNINTRVIVESLKRSWSGKCAGCKFVVDSVVLPELSSEYKGEPWFVQASSSLPKGRFSSQIIYPNVKNPASIWVTGQATTRKPVLVVTRNVQKGEFINSVRLVSEFRSIERTRGAITTFDKVNNKVTNIYLMRGDIIKPANLSDKIAFRRGESVRLVYLEGGLKIVTTAISDSVGKVGQSAWVKNLKSNKRIAGIVSEKGEVLVQ